jgi:hypothetical protein
MAQLQHNETMISQGVPNYHANPQLHRSNEVVQQYDLFGSQPNAQLTGSNDFSQQYNPFGSQPQERNSYSLSQFDQSLSNDYVNSVNSNSLPAVPGAGTITQQHYPSSLPNSLPRANPPPAGYHYFRHANQQLAVTAQQNNPFSPQWNESEGQRSLDSLPHANPQLTGTGSTNQQFDPSRAQMQENEPFENRHLVNRHGERLSDYLPDDQSEALKLVDYSSDNILYGEELEKTFDSD